MSHALSAMQIDVLNRAHSLPLLARWSVGFAVTVTKWDNRRRSRKNLLRLSDGHLKDIGLDRHTARLECRKPFWID